MKSVFLLIHGGHHGGWCYGTVARQLRAAGHEVFAPSLPGCGEHAHTVFADIDLDCHIADVVNLLFAEDLHDIILVGHSAGGMVITGVADRVSDRIRELVYLDAVHPYNGDSLRSLRNADVEPLLAGMRAVNGAELVGWPFPGMAKLFGVDDPDTMAWVDARLTPHPWKCYDRPLALRNGDAAFRLPRTNINCSHSLRSWAGGGVSRQTEGDRNYEIDTGHDLMITEPDWLVQTLIEVAAKPAVRR